MRAVKGKVLFIDPSVGLNRQDHSDVNKLERSRAIRHRPECASLTYEVPMAHFAGSRRYNLG